MKRNLLGMAILAGVVGLGSASVYLARDFIKPAQAEQPAEDALAVRDTQPTPIPIPRTTEESVPSANPFGRTAVTADYAAESNQPPANQTVAAEEPTEDIPDAGQAVDRGAPAASNPFNQGRRGAAGRSRYPEQQVSATEQADLAGDGEVDAAAEVAADEPRELDETPAERNVDRYGRPTNGARRPTAREADVETARNMNEPPAVQRERPNALRSAPETITDPPENTNETPAADNGSGSNSAGNNGDGGEDGTGRPGDPQLSGAQSPILTIEKMAPAEIQIGKPAKFLIKVRNAGAVVAHGVEIHDSVPQGTQLIESSPAAQRGGQSELVWDLGSLKPGQEQQVELQLMPTAEGEVGSVATVHFRAEASVRTMATKPMLTLEVNAPQKVMKGHEFVLKIRLSNPGSGAATGVVLSENVPEGITHPQGKELEFDVGTLKPGESRDLELGLLAGTAGKVTNLVSVRGDANLQTEARSELEVIAPQLQVALAGPKRRYLERNATHTISVNNPGTAPAKDIELVAVLPKELKFVEANNGGQFDAATHSVYWSLEELPPQESGTVTLTTLPQQAGAARLTIKGAAQTGLKDQREEVLSIEGLAAINFQLSDVSDPIEKGGQTSYEIRVTNQGTKAANNVRLVALVPREMKPLSAEGPARYKIEGNRVVFDAMKQLAPKAESVFTIKVQALEPGDLRLQAQISTDEIREPITKEESTRVFGDE